jgi:glycosyltransferase involved in cell wall biosynthesis
MKILHLLRKYNPLEWAGTETALQRLIHGLREQGVTSVVFCPKLEKSPPFDPILEAGYSVKRFQACVPIWGISSEHKQALIAMGGNLMSFDLPFSLLKEKEAHLIHAHTLGRLGAIAYHIAKRRKIPFVVSIHGGVLDLPQQSEQDKLQVKKNGFEWGKAFGYLFRSRNLLEYSDAVITYNHTEAQLLKTKYPSLDIRVQPHSVSVHDFKKNHRKKARLVFPQIRNKDLLLCVARIDPVKNQLWLVQQVPEILLQHPNAIIFFVGPTTNDAYKNKIQDEITRLGLTEKIIFTGNLAPSSPQLIGLMQEAKALILPSIAEPFGLVIIEAWAAGTVVIASKTSGPSMLINSAENGWLFDLNDPKSFHTVLRETLNDSDTRLKFVANSENIIRNQFSTTAIASQMKNLYESLIENHRKISKN